jgi:hypothetical protein
MHIPHALHNAVIDVGEPPFGRIAIAGLRAASLGVLRPRASDVLCSVTVDWTAKRVWTLGEGQSIEKPAVVPLVPPRGKTAKFARVSVCATCRRAGLGNPAALAKARPSNRG